MRRLILWAMILCVAGCGSQVTREPPALNEVRWPIKNPAWIQKYGTGAESQTYYDIFILGEIAKTTSKRITELEDAAKSDPNDVGKK